MNRIDELLRSKLSGSAEKAGADDLREMELLLGENNKKRRGAWWWWIIGMVVGACASYAIYDSTHPSISVHTSYRTISVASPSANTLQSIPSLGQVDSDSANTNSNKLTVTSHSSASTDLSASNSSPSKPVQTDVSASPKGSGIISPRSVSKNS